MIAPGERFLRLPDVIGMTGYKKSTIYELEARDEFPKRRRIGPNAVIWLETEVREWMERRLKEAA